MTVQRFDVDPVGGRDEWLALRQNDITASVAGALLGVSPYKSRFELWMEKAGRAPEPQGETAAMVRGRVLEGPALDLLAIDRPKWRIDRPNIYLRDPAARLGATPDAYAVDPARPGFGIVQVKTAEQGVFRRNWLDDEREVEPPLWIVVQAMLEAHLAGAEWACVAVMVVGFGLDLHIIDVPIHAGVIRRLREEAAAFWKSIEAGDAPEPDYGRDGALLAGLYRDDNGREVDLSGDNMLPVLLAEREALRENMRVEKARMEEIDAEIIAKIGDHERAFVPGWSLKRPLVKRRGFYVEPTEYRRLSIKKLN